MRKFDTLVVAPTDTIRAAMTKINDNGMRAVIVVDEGKVIGTVSDGDIRRALLQDVLAIAPVATIMQLNPRVATESQSGAWDRMMAQHNLTLLPIVDEESRLSDVKLAYDPFADK